MLTKNVFRLITLCFIIATRSLFPAHAEGHGDGGHASDGGDSGETHSHSHAHAHSHHEGDETDSNDDRDGSDDEAFESNNNFKLLQPEKPISIPTMGSDDGYVPPTPFVQKPNQPVVSSTIAVDESADYEENSIPDSPEAAQRGYLEDSVPAVANGLGLIKKPASVKKSQQASQKTKKLVHAKTAKTKSLKQGKLFKRPAKSVKQTNKKLPKSLH